MRELVRGETIEKVQKKVDQRKRSGWRAVSDIKLDPSQISYNVIEYVCVMEVDEIPDKQKKKWGQRYYL